MINLDMEEQRKNIKTKVRSLTIILNYFLQREDFIRKRQVEEEKRNKKK